MIDFILWFLSTALILIGVTMIVFYFWVPRDPKDGDEIQ